MQSVLLLSALAGLVASTPIVTVGGPVAGPDDATQDGFDWDVIKVSNSMILQIALTL